MIAPISIRSSIVNRDGRKLADRQARPADRQRRDDGVDAAAVGQAGIDERLALVDAAADLGDDPLDDRLGHLVGDEPPAGEFDHAVALDVNLVAADDHDFVDRRGTQQILQRAEAEDGVLEVLLQRPQDQVPPQLLMQVRPKQRKDVGELRLDLPDPAAEIGQRFELQLFVGRTASRLCSSVSRSGTSVAGTSNSFHVRRAGARRLVVAFQDQLVDDVVAQREADDLFQQRIVLLVEQLQLAADVFDVVFEQQDAFARCRGGSAPARRGRGARAASGGPATRGPTSARGDAARAPAG